MSFYISKGRNPIIFVYIDFSRKLAGMTIDATGVNYTTLLASIKKAIKQACHVAKGALYCKSTSDVTES